MTETKTEYQEVTRTATRTVQEMIPETRSIAVPVVRMVSVTKTATRTVLVAVPQTREVPTGQQRPAELAELLKAIDARWDTALPKPAVLADKEEFLKLRGHPSYRPQVPSPVR